MTALAGAVWTVTRAAEGTVAANHASGASVYAPFTAAALLRSPGAMTATGDIQYLAATGAPTALAAGATGTYLRYASGLLHVLLLMSSAALVGEGWIYRGALLAQLVWLALAAAGRLRLPIPGAGLAYYYLLVTWATLAGLTRYVRFGPPLLWERIEGTR